MSSVNKNLVVGKIYSDNVGLFLVISTKIDIQGRLIVKYFDFQEVGSIAFTEEDIENCKELTTIKV